MTSPLQSLTSLNNTEHYYFQSNYVYNHKGIWIPGTKNFGQDSI